MTAPVPLLFALLTASLQVEGSATCPRPADVEARLASVASERDYRVEIDPSDHALRVRLRDAAGAIVGERHLETSASCAELAEVTAVLVAAWTLDLPAMEVPPRATEHDPAPGDSPRLATEALAVDPPAPPPATPAPASLTSAAPETVGVERRTPVERSSHARGSTHDVFVGFAHGIGARYTEADGIFGSYVYWLTDGLGLEAGFTAHVVHRLAPEAQAVYFNFPGFDFPPLTDLYGPTWSASASAMPSLARGPSRLVGRFWGPSLEIYGVLGAGAGNVRRPEGPAFAGTSGRDDRISPVFQMGGGLRFFAFQEAIALELELRDLFFPEPSDLGGITHALQLHGGLRVSADPAAWQRDPSEDAPLDLRSRHLTVSAAGGVSLIDRFVNTRALTFSVAYDVFDFLAIETIGAILFPTESGVTLEMLERARLTPEIAKLTQLLWAVGGGLRVNALRGRFAPLGLPFDGDLTLYFSGGAAYGRTRVQCTPGLALDPEVHGPESVCPTAELGAGDDPIFVYEPQRSAAVGYVAGGVELQFLSSLAITLELRDLVFRTRVFRPQFEPTQRLTEDTRHILLGQVGLSVLFL